MIPVFVLPATVGFAHFPICAHYAMSFACRICAPELVTKFNREFSQRRTRLLIPVWCSSHLALATESLKIEPPQSLIFKSHKKPVPVAFHRIGFHAHHRKRVIHVQKSMQVPTKERLNDVLIVPFPNWLARAYLDSLRPNMSRHSPLRNVQIIYPFAGKQAAKVSFAQFRPVHADRGVPYIEQEPDAGLAQRQQHIFRRSPLVPHGKRNQPGRSTVLHSIELCFRRARARAGSGALAGGSWPPVAVVSCQWTMPPASRERCNPMSFSSL